MKFNSLFDSSLVNTRTEIIPAMLLLSNLSDIRNKVKTNINKRKNHKKTIKIAIKIKYTINNTTKLGFLTVLNEKLAEILITNYN